MKNTKWRPTKFEYKLLGTTLSLKFSIAKLISYRRRLENIGKER